MSLHQIDHKIIISYAHSVHFSGQASLCFAVVKIDDQAKFRLFEIYRTKTYNWTKSTNIDRVSLES